MHVAVLVILAIVLSAPGLAASPSAGIHVFFQAPGQVWGNFTVDGAQQAAVFFPSEHDGQSRFTLLLRSKETWTNHTYRAYSTEADPALSESTVPQRMPESINDLPAALTFSPRTGEAGSIIFRAHQIQVSGTEASAVLTPQPNNMSLASAVPTDFFEDNPYWSWTAGSTLTGIAVKTSSIALTTLTAFDIQTIQWFGMDVSCPLEACPYGGGTNTIVIGPGIKITDFTYATATGLAGNLTGQGQPGFMLLVGPMLDIEVVGAIRLPGVAGLPDCEACPPEGFTLQAAGKMSLLDLTGNHTTISSILAGDVREAFLDERPVEPQALLGPEQAIASTAVVGLLAALAKWLIAPLFTRLSKEKALEHPRRKAIFEYIQLHPGANFREIARETGIAAGTVRHHLNVLGRSELVVEHQHGSTVRLFENQAKFNQNWADLVLLREPALGQLYDWLKENSGAPQKAVLEGMDELGWSRSTTQHRLSRLVEGGLATIKLQGRLKLYSVVDRSKAVPPPSPGPSGMTRPGLNTA